MARKILMVMGAFLLLMPYLSARGSSGERYEGASLEELKSMSWDAVVEQAKKEGSVLWYVWYNQPKFREQVAKFTREYGIQVLIPEGTNSGNENKALAEAEKEFGSIDVLAYGSDSFPLLRKLFFGPLDFLPGFSERSSEIGAMQTNDYGLAYWGNQTGFAYDPNRISESELPQSLADLEAWMRKNPKLFGLADPNGGGSGQAFIQSVIRNLTPDRKYTKDFSQANADWTQVWDWFHRYTDDYSITASNADSLTRLNDGEFVIVPAWEDHMLSLQNQGAIDRRFKIYIPEMGMSGGGNFSSVMKNSPHPAASLVFLVWLTSAETQTAFNREFGAAPFNRKADDSLSAIPNEMRQRSTEFFPSEYALEAKKAFATNVLTK